MTAATTTRDMSSRDMSETAGLRGTPAHLPLSSLIRQHAHVVNDFEPGVCGSIHRSLG